MMDRGRSSSGSSGGDSKRVEGVVVVLVSMRGVSGSGMVGWRKWKAERGGRVFRGILQIKL